MKPLIYPFSLLPKSQLIFGMYLGGIVAGGLYSIPPFYFKRFPLVAALTIAFVRGFSLNFGVYYAVRESLGIPFQWNPIVIFITRFMTVFAAVIAVSKDLPDTEGDLKYNVKTFATVSEAKARFPVPPNLSYCSQQSVIS